MSPFTNRSSKAIGSLGETELIRRIKAWLGDATPPTPHGIGDDCAVFAPARRLQVITVDPVIYGRHFDDDVSPEKAGAKLLKRNLSDLAAMGARPGVAVIALAVPKQVSILWIQRFYLGLAGAARRYGVKIVGGDVAQTGAELVATLTLVGRAAGGRLLYRGKARAGDLLFVTGTLGGSRAGHHTDFLPRLKEGAWLASRPEVRSMMDVSDGVAKDAPALASKGTRVLVAPELLPVSAAAKAFSKRSGRSAVEHALTDGEDYELLFALEGTADPRAFVNAWRRRFPLRVTCIGTFTRKKSTPAGFMELEGHQGYEHLR